MKRLGEMSDGNFMYLWNTLNDITSSPKLDLDRFMRELPHGLENYYEQHWQVMGMTTEGEPTINAWILYVLCEAGTPLPAWIISSVVKPVTTEATPAFVQSRLNQWRQFLHAATRAAGEVQPLPRQLPRLSCTATTWSPVLASTLRTPLR